MTQLPENVYQTSTQSIKNITLAELEHLIEKIVRRTLQENNNNQTSKPSQAFLETFGSWTDDRNPEEIVKEIYQTRTLEQSKD
ncbi:hypothetical protein C7H19_01695 [Aphanothece hegewaldii CCALA 016]|uniref:Uncharacterized protein n=1 Tax=Aphanothece hegewaldii CCALA 016 TaxID=2107694 RepID=A0A2T1M3W5_9CHRO|nr:hypothetical protein [Aphanothece hegewaldii]PSF39529.1 hypothetical protein C7H19_01695 [Aphanothece hegewaldii CCALA 016]